MLREGGAVVITGHDQVMILSPVRAITGAVVGRVISALLRSLLADGLLYLLNA